MSFLFTSESVSEGHPDKVADQISDAILDEFLSFDPESKVACETLVTTGQVVVAGEVSSSAYVDIPSVVRRVIADIGYNKSDYGFDAKSCGILSAIHEQSPDIHRGVVRRDAMDQGAGDQGIMFGYATNETASYMPLSIDLAHQILQELALIRKEELHLMPYLRPDSKSQVTVEYNDDRTPKRIHTIVVSTQHDDFVSPEEAGSAERADEMMQQRILKDVREVLLPRVMSHYPEDIRALIDDDLILHVNPTGKFVIGGPHGDTGLTGRKIIVDTYGGMGAHGGGAFSGKDPSKVDRSAAYAARHIAKNMVAAGIADEMLVQLSYAIGVAEPISIYVNTNGRARVKMSDSEIAQHVKKLFDLRPYAIEQRFDLRKPIYKATAAYGHLGREPQEVTLHLNNPLDPAGETTLNVTYFGWERLDYLKEIRQSFGL